MHAGRPSQKLALTPLNHQLGETGGGFHDVIPIGANKGVIRSHRHLNLFFSINTKEIAVANAHLTALESKHDQLEAMIAKEEARPAPDVVKIHTLKKQKLRLKDELTGHLTH